MLHRRYCCIAHAASRQVKMRYFAVCGCDNRAISAQFVNDAALVPFRLQHNAARSIFITVFSKVMCV
jgi:UDP-glucose 4-epimerase